MKTRSTARTQTAQSGQNAARLNAVLKAKGPAERTTAGARWLHASNTDGSSCQLCRVVALDQKVAHRVLESDVQERACREEHRVGRSIDALQAVQYLGRILCDATWRARRSPSGPRARAPTQRSSIFDIETICPRGLFVVFP